jgi:hypothetical protein
MLMSINSPLMPGPYSHRAVDCERAIERDFFRVIQDSSTAYLDADRILMLLAEDATNAGWSEEELTAAVQALAAQHNMQRFGRTHE